MITLPNFLRMLVIACLISIHPLHAAEPDDPYLIQAGDILTISVWKEEDLQRDVIVRPDGGISFPLAGDIMVAGSTVPDVQSRISNSLKEYIPNPSVSVALRQLSGNKIYVIGQVSRPGEFQVNRYVDVMQALSMAGGMTPYAAVNKIVILRRSGDKASSIPFAYSEVEKGQNLKQNIILQSGDVVVVP